MEKISQPVRILAIVIVLVGSAGMLALRTMGPSAEVEAPRTVVALPRPKPAKSAAAKPAKPVAPAKAASAPAVNAPKPTVRATGFPKAVDVALAQHEVLVVSLVVPGARLDALTAAEAAAGAKLGGAGYLALNVLNEQVAHALLTKLGPLQNPSVLVLKRSGKIALELGGFVDRETVAQATANASS